MLISINKQAGKYKILISLNYKNYKRLTKIRLAYMYGY